MPIPGGIPIIFVWKRYELNNTLDYLVHCSVQHLFIAKLCDYVLSTVDVFRTIRLNKIQMYIHTYIQSASEINGRNGCVLLDSPTEQSAPPQLTLLSTCRCPTPVSRKGPWHSYVRTASLAPRTEMKIRFLEFRKP